MKNTKLLPIFLFLLIIVFNCKENKQNNNNIDTVQNFEDTNIVNNISETLDIVAKFIITSEKPGVCGKNIKVSFDASDSIKIDSIEIYFDEKKINSFFSNTFELEITTENETVGGKKIYAKVYSDNKFKTFEQNIVLLSDIIPQKLKYKVIKEYPHDVNAYTQGLVYEDGILYEATGLDTKSSLRKVDLNTGEVLFSFTIPNNFFGEGITIVNEKIIQITWQNNTGFVYDKKNFQVLAEFNYNTEGWGLTFDGEFLYMTDGSHIIYVLDPNTYSVVKQIPVLDNKDRVFYLNELEYINGFIYANIYLTEQIVKIDPKTGKVVATIDFTGLLPDALKTEDTDVLNGIAFDKKNNRIFVTGKNWPKLYEVVFL